MTNKKALLLMTTAALAITATQLSFAEQALVVSDDIRFAETSNANDKVKDECQLGTKLSKFIRHYSKKSKFTIISESKSKSDMVLNVEIGDVLATAGGAFSGPKSMRVKGTLTQGDKELGNFEGRRYSTGGAFAVFKGTCSILGRDAKALGKDIAQWLKDPQKDSQLGDLS